jgi:hypothetical protein
MISELRAEGVHSQFGNDTARAVQALSDGFADGARLAMLIASVFLLLGFVGAIRLRISSKREVPALPAPGGGVPAGEVGAAIGAGAAADTGAAGGAGPQTGAATAQSVPGRSGTD